jgi:hypothetical protein
MGRFSVWLLLALAIPALVEGQARKPQSKPPAKPKTTTPARPAQKKEPATIKCTSELGVGVKTKRTFCDVLTGRQAAEGILIAIPKHTGAATLSFDLHNRQTYSETQVKAGRGYAEYTATIGVLAPDGTVVARGGIISTFRTASDLFDRVGGGAGPGGVKAVAPTGVETIAVAVPDKVTELSLLGEKLVVQRVDGRETFTSAGRPIAVVSNLTLEYTPAPGTKPPAKPAARKKP